ncbi:hypothetical protein ILUMI_05938 [Ignelater luminosus]|uniref:Uncharacterized protein n=1 Tax=Ignelater luminosus TaxID=2038154 RepID=A0A8K0DC35_IGNLU|nr:hypothetical protein ILUMI_05938 [Ignelater luminosus]
MVKKLPTAVPSFRITVGLTITFLLSNTLLLNVYAFGKTDCPSKCKCDKTTIRCTEKSLTVIPDFKRITIRLTTLDLGSNDIEEVKMVHFYSKKLETVQQLLLNDNSVYLIEASAFATLRDLQYLDLSNNLLEDIPHDVVKKNQNLTKLNLSGNLFNSKAPVLVSSSLKILDLSVSKITSFTESNLKGLPNLKVLYLYSNNLKYIDYDIFVNVRLQQIDLFYNPWKCDCNTVKMFNYLESNNMTKIDKPVQCMHKNKWYEDIHYTNASVYQHKLCKSVEEQNTYNNNNSTKSVGTSNLDTNEINILVETDPNLNNLDVIMPTGIIIVIGAIVVVSVLVSLVSLVIVMKKLRVEKPVYAEVNHSFASV